jgi:hypothetical protein
VPPQPTFIELAARLANKYEFVADALRFFLEPTWFNLYKVYELISDDVGGSKAIAAQFGITEAQQNRFTGSANNRGASGDAARHALKQKPMKNPMPLKDGQALMRRLLDQWIRSK